MIRLVQAAQTSTKIPQHSVQLHIDGGANRSITNNINYLLSVCNIKPYYVSSAGSDSDIKCTAVGYLPWQSLEQETILVKCYYSAQASDTIISPSNIVLAHNALYHTWTQHSDCQSGQGYIQFMNNDTKNSITYRLYQDNGLWFYHNSVVDYHTSMEQTGPSRLHQLQTSVLYELIHARMGHPGEHIMADLHNYVDGIDKLTKPSLYECHACLLAKSKKCAVPQHKPQQKVAHNPALTPTASPQQRQFTAGQKFHIDMGFVRGTLYSGKDEDGRKDTSLDGYNSYISIIDRATRYTWAFMSKNKVPKVDIIAHFLKIHGAKTDQQCYIQTDKGGEL
jgi:hypothetical protein